MTKTDTRVSPEKAALEDLCRTLTGEYKGRLTAVVLHRGLQGPPYLRVTNCEAKDFTEDVECREHSGQRGYWWSWDEFINPADEAGTYLLASARLIAHVVRASRL